MPWPPEVQDVVAKHKMQVLYEQYGNWHDVAIVWNAGSVVSWDEVYWQKVINSGGTRVEKTIKLTVLLKMMLVAIAAMIFGHITAKTVYPMRIVRHLFLHCVRLCREMSMTIHGISRAFFLAINLKDGWQIFWIAICVG